MIRGTTPTLRFTLPINTDLIEDAYITFSQNRTVVFEKGLDDCEVAQRSISVHLTQVDTLELVSECNTEIQIRVKTTAGDALASKIITVDTGRILKEGSI